MKNRGCPLRWGDARFSLLVDRSTRRENPCRTPPAIGGSATAGALLRLRIHRWRAGRGRDSSFAWNGPREGRISRHPNAKGTQGSSFARARSNASAFPTGSRRKRSIVGLSAHERRILRPPRARAAARDPRPAPMPAARSRPLSQTTPSEGRGSAPVGRDRPQAAHQQPQTSCGSAPASPDPPRARTGKVATTGNLQATLRARGAGRPNVRRTARGCWTPRDATGRRGPRGRAGRRRPRRSAGRRCWPPAASAACRSGR